MKGETMEKLVNVGQIALDFNCSERQIRNFVAAGMPRARHGKYDRLECLLWYSRKLKCDIDAAGDISDLEREQIRVQKATADLKEIELSDRRASLMPRWLFEKHVQMHFEAVRRAILPLADQIAPELEGLDRLEIRTRLHQKYRAALSQLATGSDVIEESIPGTDMGENVSPEMVETAGKQPATRAEIRSQ